jgi:hypothetical protein
MLDRTPDVDYATTALQKIVGFHLRQVADLGYSRARRVVRMHLACKRVDAKTFNPRASTACLSDPRIVEEYLIAAIHFPTKKELHFFKVDLADLGPRGPFGKC